MADLETLLADTRYFVDQGSDPSAPSAGNRVLYTKAGGLFLRGSAAIVGPILDETAHDLLDHTGLTGVAAGKLSTIALTASETGKTDATLTNTGLLFAITSGVIYSFRFYCSYRSTSNTVGIKLGLTYPSLTVFSAQVLIGGQAAAGVVGAWHAHLNSATTSASSTDIDTTGTDRLAIIQGIIQPSASGTLRVQYAAETTGATVTLRQGSTGELVAHS